MSEEGAKCVGGMPVMGKDASGNAQYITVDSTGSLVAAPTSTARLLSAANTTNSTLVKNSSARLFRIIGVNAAAGVRYLKLYNKATAPTVGTDVPIMTIALPATAAFNIDFGSGYVFPLGLGFGLTVAAADNDTTAVTAADIIGLNITYT